MNTTDPPGRDAAIGVCTRRCGSEATAIDMPHAEMPPDPTDPPAPTPPPTDVATSPTHAPRAGGAVSRRRLLGGLVAGVGLVGVAGSRMDSVAAQFRATDLDRAGQALEPARRIPPPTTTTTTTVPTSDDPDTTTVTTVPLADGEIRFPIVVGEDDFCWVSDSFGDCRGVACSRSHEGVDIMADRGLPVVAPVAGTLTKRYEDYGATSGAGHGWTLHDAETDITYKFFHLDRHADGLEVDDEVEAGDVIGYVGNTGTSGAFSDSNYHLHFEYRPGNVPEDSYDLLQRVPHVDWEH